MQVSKGFREQRQEAVREAEGNLDKRRSRRGKPKEKGRVPPRWAANRLLNVACGMFQDRRNRFIRLWLYSCLRLFLAFLVLMTARACRVWRSGTRVSSSRGLKT